MASFATAPTAAITSAVGHASQETTETEPQGNQDTNNNGASRSSDEEAGEEEFENPNRPKGVKFAILFLCILLGDFFVGYVRLP